MTARPARPSLAQAREVWRRIERYDKYDASSLGRIRSRCRREVCILKPITSRGHQYVNVYYRDTLSGRLVMRHEWVHRLVLEVFHGPPPPGCYHGAHLDGNPFNNNIRNLKWKTPSENYADTLRHGRAPIGSRRYNAKATERDVLAARRMYSRGEPLEKIVLRLGGLGRRHAIAVIQGRGWRHVRVDGGSL